MVLHKMKNKAMKKHLNQYHFRQVMLLRDLTERYIKKLIDLKYFISDVCSLIDILEEDKNWIEEFGDSWTVEIRTLCLDLEVIFATNIIEDENKTYLILDEESFDQINKIIFKIKDFINEKIEYLKLNYENFEI